MFCRTRPHHGKESASWACPRPSCIVRPGYSIFRPMHQSRRACWYIRPWYGERDLNPQLTLGLSQPHLPFCYPRMSRLRFHSQAAAFHSSPALPFCSPGSVTPGATCPLPPCASSCRCLLSLLPELRAVNGPRTRNPRLGRPMLCPLSYHRTAGITARNRTR